MLMELPLVLHVSKPVVDLHGRTQHAAVLVVSSRRLAVLVSKLEGFGSVFIKEKLDDAS